MMCEKYAIVTGASRGLGSACAEELANEGYNVVITYQSKPESAEEVKERLEKQYGVNVETYKLSVGSEDEVAEFRKWCEEKWEKICRFLLTMQAYMPMFPQKNRTQSLLRHH